ncbi:MFS transporter [Cellulomonas sp. Leaf395]|uniref:MFS transporter n=1 Tax=Cellulomonas sp. Leaf395 TaxID=1736362 RepID=UPI00070007AE|nr:MFS transporter [Cellulomonas sp. Leaf395]KQS99335.1 MFS transporter [Cellulomonas sp. Leaf395]
MSGQPRDAVAPLYAAGFVTAFGAHSVAAGLGASGEGLGLSLLRIGILIALYDVAEVILKPVFGSLSDRVGAKPVIVGGLVAFAVTSSIGVWGSEPLVLVLARLGQGAAASAFSPASSATVARLAGPGRTGRYFGRYGSWKALGYTLGPLIGAALLHLGGFPLLFVALAGVAALTAAWVAVRLPRIEPLPRPRYTVADVLRQSTHRAFVIPTVVLAASTGALGAAIGFLPALADHLGASLLVALGIASVLALCSTFAQPLAGAARDRHLVTDPAGMTCGLLLTAGGVLLAAVWPAVAGLYLAGGLIGVGIGAATPFAFAYLADTTPHERMGRTMGTAELGRELGDAGGPLLVGAVATLWSLPVGLGALALVLAATSALPGGDRLVPASAPTAGGD